MTGACVAHPAPLGLLSPPVQVESEPASLPKGLIWGLAGVVLAALLSSLDQRVSTAAIADLLGGFDLGRDEGSWVSTAYTVGDIAIVPVTPWLAQLISPRRAVAAEIVLFVVAGAACPVAPGYGPLIALRFLQGAGEGGLVPLMLLSILRFTPPRHKPEAFALYAVVSTLVPLLADPLAGVATELVTWQVLFYYTVALGPVALALVLIFLPVEPPKWERFANTNYFSMACLVVSSSMLAAGLGQGQRLDWFDSALIVALFTGTAYFFIAFLGSELLGANPLFDLSLIRRPNFAVGLALVLVFNIGLLGATYVEPQTQTLIRGLKPLQIGLLFLLLAVPQLVIAPLAAALMRVVDARLLVGTGLAMSSLGAYLCTYVSPTWAPGDFLWPLLLQACAWPLTFPPLVFLTTSVLKPEDALTGGTLFNVVRTVAIAAGPALVGAIITVRERVHSFYLVQHLVPGSATTDPRLAAGMPALAAAVRVQAYVLAFADAFGWLCVLLAAGMALVLLQTEAPVIRAGRPR